MTEETGEGQEWNNRPRPEDNQFPEVPGGSAHEFAPEAFGAFAHCACGFMPAFNPQWGSQFYAREMEQHIRYERTQEIIAWRTQEKASR